MKEAPGSSKTSVLTRATPRNIPEEPFFNFKRIQTFYRRLSLAPSDFFLLSKIIIKLKGRRFVTVGEIQAETQTVLNALTKKHNRMHLKSGRNAGIGVCAPKGTNLKMGTE
jgi:hypothetical protein